MATIRSTSVHRLVAVHVLLAVVPVAMPLAAADMRMLPLVWALASVTFAQITLLAIWIGMMTAGRFTYKLFAAIVAVAFVAIWHTAAQVLMAPSQTFVVAIQDYLQNFVMIGVLLILLSLVLFGVSRLVGTIRLPEEDDLPLAEPRFHFSLLALLAIATSLAVLLGLVRITRTTERPVGEGEGVADYLLAVTVYGLNTLATIWATLGPGHVWRRLGVVLFVSVLLGLCFAVAMGNSPDMGGWWFFLSHSVVVIVPSMIVALTLLYLRRLGFRVIPRSSMPMKME